MTSTLDDLINDCLIQNFTETRVLSVVDERLDATKQIRRDLLVVTVQEERARRILALSRPFAGIFAKVRAIYG